MYMNMIFEKVLINAKNREIYTIFLRSFFIFLNSFSMAFAKKKAAKAAPKKGAKKAAFKKAAKAAPKKKAPAKKKVAAKKKK